MEKIALTLLSCYPDISFYAAGIEALIRRIAVYSYSGISMRRHKTTFQQASDIIALIEKKNDLLWLKDIIGKTLGRLADKQKLLARRAFFEKKSKEEIMEEMNLTKRTLYRRLHALLVSFAKNLALGQFDREWFEEECLKQSWIKNIHRRETKLLP